MIMRVVSQAEYRRMRWKNGAGWTTELATSCAGEAWTWRISIAEIDADGDFSSFPGVDRSILVLGGAGMALTIGEQAPVELHAGGPALVFAGEAAVRCRLLAGPTRDFNVMTRRGAVTHTLGRARAGGLALRDAGFVYVVRGAAVIEGHTLATGDSLRIDEAPAEPVIVQGAAELLVVRFVGALSPV